MRLQLVTPERLVLDADVEEVYAPGVLGEFGVLPQHITFLTALTVGELRYRQQGRDHHVAVTGGFAEVLGDQITVLADAAEPAGEINVERARAAERSASERLAKTAADSPEHVDVQSALARALNRAAVAGRRAR